MWFLECIAAIGATVVTHALVARLVPSANRVLVFFAVGGAIGVILVAFTASSYGYLAPQTFAAALLYAFVCELYVFLFTLALSSISANLLARLYHGTMTAAEVEILYDSSRMVSVRVHRLVNTNLLRVGQTGIEVTDKGRRLLRTLDAMRAFFGHDSADICRT